MSKDTRVAVIGGLSAGVDRLNLATALATAEHKTAVPITPDYPETHPDFIPRRPKRPIRKPKMSRRQAEEGVKEWMKNTYKNRPCFCGSGVKFKKCCRQLPRPLLIKMYQGIQHLNNSI